MKEIMLIVILALPGTMMDPIVIPQPDIKTCVEAVEAKTTQMLEVNEKFFFTAACQVRSVNKDETP